MIVGGNSRITEGKDRCTEDDREDSHLMGGVRVESRTQLEVDVFHLVKKPLVLVKNGPNRLYG